MEDNNRNVDRSSKYEAKSDPDLVRLKPKYIVFMEPDDNVRVFTCNSDKEYTERKYLVDNAKGYEFIGECSSSSSLIKLLNNFS